MEWELINAFEQIDTVGNVYQKGGGVIPKACQKCKKEFKSEIIETPVTQKVPYFKCKDCGFENAGSNAALDHLILTKHGNYSWPTLAKLPTLFQSASLGCVQRAHNQCSDRVPANFWHSYL